MSKYALVNCKIFTGEKFITDKSLVIENGLIKDILSMQELKDAKVSTVIDLKGGLLSSGFIDLQINGCGGKPKMGCRFFSPVSSLDKQGDDIAPSR
jgi:N-acetylglucosamine-6-phosphate deacetylase